MHIGVLGGGPIGVEMAVAGVRCVMQREITNKKSWVDQKMIFLQEWEEGHTDREGTRALLQRPQLGTCSALQSQQDEHVRPGP